MQQDVFNKWVNNLSTTTQLKDLNKLFARAIYETATPF